MGNNNRKEKLPFGEILYDYCIYCQNINNKDNTVIHPYASDHVIQTCDKFKFVHKYASRLRKLELSLGTNLFTKIGTMSNITVIDGIGFIFYLGNRKVPFVYFTPTDILSDINDKSRLEVIVYPSITESTPEMAGVLFVHKINIISNV